MAFVHFVERPTDLTVEFLKTQYDELIARIPAAEEAESGQLWIELAESWNDLKAYVGGEARRRNYQYSRDLGNKEAEERERYFRSELAPVADAGMEAMTKALLNSKHRDAVAERFGPRLLTVLDMFRDPSSPVNSKLRSEVGELCKQYDKIKAAGEISVGGQTMTLARARGLISSENPETRKEAYLAHRGYFLNNRDALAEIFDKVVKLRQKMAENLGYENFVALGYKGMLRTDYGPTDVDTFRQLVRDHIVPVYRQILEEQAQSNGQEQLRPWDRFYDPKLSLASGVAEPIQDQLDRVARVFKRLSPTLSAHFERMREQQLIDLENRKNKAPGAFCTTFPDERRVAIFCNSVGDSDDVSTLLHEMGHAFQGWESATIDAVELRSPSFDACEVHSMGMEYLAQPYLDEFFEPESVAKFCRYRWRESIALICYCCVVDAYQHWVYENPEATYDERDAIWNKYYDEFIPAIDWSGHEPLKAMRWYAQLHIFHAPFYYIDYAIAELTAMQLAMAAAESREKTMEVYMELCRLGGTLGVLEILKVAGATSPFDGQGMKAVMDYAKSVLFAE